MQFLITADEEFVYRITDAAKKLGLNRSAFIRLACSEKILEMKRMEKIGASVDKTEANGEPHNSKYGGSDDKSE